MSKGSFYFSHDYDTRSDERIKNLLRKHGMLGFGVYWAIVEDLYTNANALQADYDGIAYDLRVSVEVVTSVINDFKLFTLCDKSGICVFSSDSIQRRLDARNIKSIKATESANKRWGNANAMRPHSEGNAIKERKGKEIKEKESKEDKELKKELFEKFWQLYDKKVDRQKCLDKFNKLKSEDIEKILLVVPDYVASTQDVKFRKNPLTWLNGKCWNDEKPNYSKLYQQPQQFVLTPDLNC